MDKKTIKQLEAKLLEEKDKLERGLEEFAEKDKNVEGDWDTRFPAFNAEGGSSSNLEGEEDEVEEYSTLLSLERTLEERLRDVNAALEKIKKGKYGICERCGGRISEKRLKINPEAKYCMKCRK